MENVRLLLTWRDSGLAPPDEGGLLGQLSTLPVQGVVFALSRIAQGLERGGEAAPATQLGLADFLLGRGVLRNRVRRRIREGFVYATRAGTTALTRVALSRCRSGPEELTQADREVLARLLISVNEYLTCGHLLRDEPDHYRARAISRLFMFLAVNSGGSEERQNSDLLAWSFGALCARAASRGTRDDRAMGSTLGVGIRDLHAAIGHALAAFETEKPNGDFTDVYEVPSSAAGSPLDMRALIDALSARAGGAPLELSAAASPITSESEMARWRPLFRSGGLMVCWDRQLLRRLASFNFPDVVRQLAPQAPQLGDRIDTAWNKAVEEALSEAFGFYRGTDAVVRMTSSLLAARQHGETNQVADWFVICDDDLFVVEWKNLRLPPGTFGEVEPERFDRWVADRLTANEGFVQVYNTITRAQRGWNHPGTRPGRPLREFRRVWPVVILPFHFPMEGLMSAHLRDQVHAHVAVPNTPELQPPLALHAWELMAALAHARPGDVIADWQATARRAPLLSMHSAETPSLAGLIKYGSDALHEVILAAEALTNGGQAR